MTWVISGNLKSCQYILLKGFLSSFPLWLVPSGSLVLTKLICTENFNIHPLFYLVKSGISAILHVWDDDDT